MSGNSDRTATMRFGMIGFGAFGQLMALHLRPYFPIVAFDTRPDADQAAALGVSIGSLEDAASCPVVILAVPIGQMREVAARLAPLLLPGTLVLDVGSIKVEPASAMRELLPDHIDVVATHPLFGPQSACDGIDGLRIAICPIRGRRLRVAAFCRMLGLEVIMTSPEAHDREIAQVQGITHLIASVLGGMDLQPTRLTTRSFEILMSAMDMVRHDAPEVFQAILRGNPYAGDILRRFKAMTSALDEPA